MKTINLKVKITVPDDYILDDSDWLLEDCVSGKFDYSTSLYEDKNKCKIFIDILFLIGVVCLSSCNGNRTTYSDNSNTHADYNINYYIDTINGHLILSTVVDSKYYNNVSISTLELK